MCRVPHLYFENRRRCSRSSRREHRVAGHGGVDGAGAVDADDGFRRCVVGRRLVDDAERGRSAAGDHLVQDHLAAVAALRIN